MAVDPNIQEKANDIRMKIYGEQVRESLASGLEAMSSDVVEVEGRQDEVESQFQDVIENTTDKDVVSAPEIIAARNGKDNLKDRIDTFENDTTAQLAQKVSKVELDNELEKKVNQTDLETANQNISLLQTNKAEQSYVDNQFSNIADGTPKGVYDTVSALQNAYPNGTTGIYVVALDGKWYYWNGSQWNSGGTYQGVVIADKTIKSDMLKADYNYRGFFFGDNYDANNLLDDGRYYVASSVLNSPKRNYFETENVAVILEVERYNTRIIQKARPINYPNEVYYRYTDSTFAGVKWVWLQRENKQLWGKKVILMGDSLTDKGKQHLTIWEKTGADVDRIAIGGTTMSNHGNSEDYSKLSFYSLAKAISTGDYSEQETAVNNITSTDLSEWLQNFKSINWNEVDYLLVRYGTNDHAMDNPIGEISRDNFDTSTYIGAFNQGVKDILTACPHIRIFVATSLWRYNANIGVGGDSDTTPNNNGDYLVDFVDTLREASGFNHLPFRDYYRQSGINSYTNTHYLSDQTHPNDAGSKLLGEIDSNFIMSE
ncbi:GDSL-type esterase/lipase family protein [Marinilactibacillus psychrotolerans]|uniref:GDSL-type esterase/lipase family protein n=1 Tax=Marinilactibacillus psychrotolerans TaxID=191770 RepID=UPI0038884633